MTRVLRMIPGPIPAPRAATTADVSAAVLPAVPDDGRRPAIGPCTAREDPRP